MSRFSTIVSILAISFLFGAAAQAQPTQCDVKELLGTFQNAKVLPAALDNTHWVVKDKVIRGFLMKNGQTDFTKVANIHGLFWGFYPTISDVGEFAMALTTADNPLDPNKIVDESQPVLVVLMLEPEDSVDTDPEESKTLYGHMYKSVEGECVAVAKLIFRPSANKKKAPWTIEVRSMLESTDAGFAAQQTEAMGNLLQMVRARDAVTGNHVALNGKMAIGTWNWHEKELLRSYKVRSAAWLQEHKKEGSATK